MLANAAIDSLASAPVLAFAAAFVASLLKADVSLPDGMYAILSTYLLFAIGLKGGKGLAEASFGDLAGPLVAAIAVGLVTPLVAYSLLRWVGRLQVVDAAATAAHYGSVSAVTFTVVLTFVANQGSPAEPFMAGLLTVLEVVGILVALTIALRGGATKAPWRDALSEVVRGRSISLLVVGLVVGWVAGPERLAPVDPLFVDLFQGALVLFLLEMGVVTARRLRDARTVGPFVVVLAIVIPLANGVLGAAAGSLAGLSVGGTAVLATLAASASYIAAPAAVRIALPNANPAIYVTASLGVTFPFNVLVGIPIYWWIAEVLT
jgi:uncharacterized protein